MALCHSRKSSDGDTIDQVSPPGGSVGVIEMGRYRAIAASLAIAAGLPTPAMAQGGPEKQVYEIGQCIAAKDRDAAAALLRDLPFGTGSFTLDGARLGGAARCLAQPQPVRARTMRGALAQALLLRDFPRFGIEPRVAPRLFARLDLPLEPRAGVDARTANLYKLADCVVRNRAIESEPLFRSGLGSGVEDRVIDSFGPTIAACQKLSAPAAISRADFRGLLAEAAYDVSVRYWSGQLSPRAK
ncbi:MAG: hypothetical protein JWP15_668 [Alphaproteobacteria bacterium]|nr:hypothetical protein [Alphaproteobacteria bacterium]